jgi:lysophospholipase L1-like esterase
MRRKAILAVFGSILASLAGAEPGGAPTRAPDPWRGELQAFAESDAESPPARGGVVFVGSSSIRLWDLPRWFPDLGGPVLNRGFGGSHVSDSVEHVELLVTRHRPRAVVFYAGDNDLAEGRSAGQVANEFRRFVAAVRQELPSTPIVFIAIKPSTLRWGLADKQRDTNRRVRAQCDADPLLHYVDIWPAMLGADGKPRPELLAEDGLHLSAAGYRVWTDLVIPVLDRAAPTRSGEAP